MPGRKTVITITATFIASLFSAAAWAQQITTAEKDQAEAMLQAAAGDVRKNYYDPKFHGVNWDTTVADAKGKVDRGTSLAGAFSDIAAALETLKDSHTFFVPPQHSRLPNYGLQYGIIGDRCFVIRVRPDSEAAAKKLKPGDELMTINDVKPSRDTLHSIQYAYAVMRSQPGLRLNVVDPSGNKRDVSLGGKKEKEAADSAAKDGGDVWTSVRQDDFYDHIAHAQYAEYGDPLLVVKAPEFSFTTADVQEMMARAGKHKALIVDLRGNPGGSLESLQYMVGGVFDGDVKIADRVTQAGSTPLVAKSLSGNFAGPVVVLVDGRTSGAAELFARVMQLEKRGVVLGDRSAGSAMEAKHYDEKTGADSPISFGVSVTIADLIMSDGKSLEHVGVIPDQTLLLGAKALASGRDPILARGAEVLGVKLDPGDAGKVFPYELPQ